MITKNRRIHKTCTGSHLARITGLKLCGEIQFPNASLETSAPYFPLTGPISLDVSLMKEDSHKSYNVEARLSKVLNFLYFDFCLCFVVLFFFCFFFFNNFRYIKHFVAKNSTNCKTISFPHNFQTKKEVNIRLAFDTPGSQTDRALSAEFLLDKIGSKLQMGLQSPWNKAVFTGIYLFSSIIFSCFMTF